MSEGEHIRTERRGPILVITIDRPQVKNAFDMTTADRMSRAIDTLEQEPDLSVGVITGAGGEFSSGMDAAAYLRSGEVPYVAHRGIFGVINEPPVKPLVAAVEGVAYAGGFELMLTCDLAVVAEDAMLAINEVRRGTCSVAGGLLELPRRVPAAIAAELALTGEPITATRALEVGLINRVTPSGGALEQALQLAELIAANAPLAVVASKRVLREAPGWSEDEAWARQGEIVGSVMRSADAKEGMRAFKEGREPRWSGS